MTEELPPIIKTLESLVNDLVEYDQHLQTLEHDRELSEDRLNTLLQMAKTSKEIGVDIKYPVEQIKELDEALSEIIESIKLQVAERAVIECEFEKVKAEVEAEGWSRVIDSDLSCRWERSKKEESESEFIIQLQEVKKWIPMGENPTSAYVIIAQIDQDEKQVMYDINTPYGSSRLWNTFEKFQKNFKPEVKA